MEAGRLKEAFEFGNIANLGYSLIRDREQVIAFGGYMKAFRYQKQGWQKHSNPNHSYLKQGDSGAGSEPVPTLEPVWLLKELV